jgi:hypothetical protein
MVDRIGKGGPKVPTPATGGTPKAGETGRAFEIKKPEGADPSAAAHAASAVSGQTPIERLRSGQLDLHGYLDAKVKEATSHLQGLSPAELDALKSMLRDQVASDPALADLFEKATGHAPPASDE